MARGRVRRVSPRADRATRISLSLEPGLLTKFDAWVEAKKLSTRSEGFRELVRAKLVERAYETGKGEVVATVSFTYDHHRRELMERLAHLQHEHLALIVSSLHVHLDHNHCLEVLVLRGPGREVKDLAERVLATKGVISGDVSLAAAGATLGRPPHAHG